MTSDEPQPRIAERLLEWLNTQGYPLELRSASIFARGGFSVQQGIHVHDTETHKQREIDLSAIKKIGLPNDPFLLCYAVECKWSRDKPWVSFVSDTTIDPSQLVAETIASEVGDLLLWAMAGDPQLHATSTFQLPSRLGYGGRQAFSSEAKDTFYSSLQSVVSAAKSIASSYDQRLPPHLHEEEPLKSAPLVVFPIIVLSGVLYEASLHDDELTISEVNVSRVRWSGVDVGNIVPTVTIVTVDHLPRLLEDRATDYAAISGCLSASLANLRQCFAAGDMGKFILTEGRRGSFRPPRLLSRLWQRFQDKT